VRYIALEEAFSIPGLAERQEVLSLSSPQARLKPGFASDWERRLADFTEDRITDMDKNGIDIQVLSLTVPGMQISLDAGAAVANARFANDFLASVIKDNPQRFRGFAALPLQDPDAAVRELERCVGEFGFCGALVNNCADALYLDHERFSGLWSALQRLAVPLYLHPGIPPADHWDVLAGYPEMYGALWSWGAETAGHALRLIFNGVFDRCPNATLILGHMGEFLPYQRSRINSRWDTITSDHRLERLPSEYLGSNVVFTTSGVFSPAALTGTVLEVGADAVMFSIDYPYESSQAAVEGFERTTLSDADRHKIAHGNAERLLRIPPA
jgi:2,3-dihydroxybenzoate decarboxylase